MDNSTVPQVRKYNHVEAFCLMYYRSTSTGRDFYVWNSRDGVTPFCIIEEGEEFQHTHFNWDRCLPDYELSDGQRFFRDTTPAEAAYIALRRMELYNGKYFIGPESQRLLPDTKLWYETWARVTESFIGHPIVMLHDVAPDKIATELISWLNSDNDYNYPYTVRQHELLTERVRELKAGGALFDSDTIVDIVSGPDSCPDYTKWESLGEILDDIFNGVDENGDEMPIREQTSPFDSEAYPMPAPIQG